MSKNTPQTRAHPATGIILGERYRDQLHQIEGVATAVTEYLHGCAQVAIEYLNADGDVVDRYIDIGQLTHVDSGRAMKARPAVPAAADGAVTG